MNVQRRQPFLTIAVAAFKGGVGKSTTAAGLAQEFSREVNTALVDCDPQQSASSARTLAVTEARRDGMDVTFENVYDFTQTRVDTSMGRDGTLRQLRKIAAGEWTDPFSDEPTPFEVPQVMVIDTPPGDAVVLGVADFVAASPRGSMIVVTTPNDLDLGNSLQTYRNFQKTHPELKSWMLLNQVIKARAEHKELTPDLLGFDTFKTVVPTHAEISRMFRYDTMRSHRGTRIYNAIAAELLEYWENAAKGAA